LNDFGFVTELVQFVIAHNSPFSIYLFGNMCPTSVLIFGPPNWSNIWT